MLDDEEETDKHFSALPSNSKWLLIPQVISVTSGLCNLSSLIFLDKELLCVLHFKIGWKLWKVESQGFTKNFLIISPTDNNAFDCVLHTWNLSVLHPSPRSIQLGKRNFSPSPSPPPRSVLTSQWNRTSEGQVDTQWKQTFAVSCRTV